MKYVLNGEIKSMLSKMGHHTVDCAKMNSAQKLQSGLSKGGWRPPGGTTYKIWFGEYL